jgi:allophanate hydrolase subunit 2
MIGTVISADMDLIGQLRPHAPVNFVETDLEGALTARNDREILLSQLRDHLS